MLLMSIASLLASMPELKHNYCVIETGMSSTPAHRAHIPGAKGDLVEIRQWLVFDPHAMQSICKMVATIFVAADHGSLAKDNPYIKHIPLEFYKPNSEFRLNMATYLMLFTNTLFMSKEDLLHVSLFPLPITFPG